MRNRRNLLVLLAAVIVAGGALLWFMREKEPSYEGRRLSEWIAINDRLAFKRNTISDESQKQEAVDAIRHIGTKALPYLLAWIDEPAEWKLKLLAASRKLPKSLAQSRPITRLLSSGFSDTRAQQATSAFMALGPIAAPAVPELTRRIHLANSTRRFRAMLALASIGPAALPAMTDLLSKFDQENAMMVTDGIGRMGTNARPLVPLLVPHLQSTNWKLARNTASVLGGLKSDPELVVPALIKGLDNPNNLVQIEMLLAVRQFGELARPSLPALSNALNHANANVQNLASNAIWRITTAPDTNAPPR